MSLTPEQFAAATKLAIRDKSDELAVKKYGCRFNPARAMFAIDWIQNYCILYEGEAAGQPLILMPWAADFVARLTGWEIYSKSLDVNGKPKGWIRRFNSAIVFVPKKNGKSPLLAALALYCLVGEGEPGNKVYLAAKNANQSAEIAGKHAMEMVKASPALSREIKINLNYRTLTHIPTESIMKSLSGANESASKGNEGLNGSIFVDEAHVVPREFISRISRAGISRREPFHIEVSTAGTDPSCYGKQRFDLALDIINGNSDLHRTLAIIYAAPQDLSDEELDADPLKYITMANPALNKTVDPQDALDDYRKSKRSAADLAEFKMYRLNIWGTTSRPWIQSANWAACRREYSLEDLRGRECYGGVDLSYVSDTSALSLIFPNDDGTYYLWSQIFVPQKEVFRADSIPYVDWQSKGYCEIIPGPTMKDVVLAAKMVDLLDRYDLKLRTVNYDSHYARNVAEELELAGAAPKTFSQYYSTFATPTARFESLVLEEALYHPGNDCLTWQVLNTVVLSQSNGYGKPVKPSKNDHSIQKVDACQAAVMALAAAMLDEGAEPDPMAATNDFYSIPHEERIRIMNGQ